MFSALRKHIVRVVNELGHINKFFLAMRITWIRLKKRQATHSCLFCNGTRDFTE